jgi:hypothetical protein
LGRLQPGSGLNDAFIYGHIAPSKVLGGGLIQLEPDTFNQTKKWHEFVRDAETWLQWQTVGGGQTGTDFDTIFVGPTSVP